MKEATARIVERARNLFAMSQDTSSPHEAEIAARRVRVMLDEYGITMEDLARPEESKLKFGAGTGGRAFRRPPGWHGVLAFGVAVYMDCKVSCREDCESGDYVTVFEGFDADAAIAGLMMDYLLSAMDRGLLVFRHESRTRGVAAGNSFRAGFASRMQQRLVALAKDRSQPSTGSSTALVTVAKREAVEREFGAQRTRRNSVKISDGGAALAGRTAADRTSLNSQIGSGASTAGRLK